MTKFQFWYEWNFEKLWYYFHRFCGFQLTGEFSLNIYYNKDFLGIVLKYLAEVRIGTVQWFLGRSMLASGPDLHFLMNLTFEYFYKATKPRKFEINSPGRIHFRFFVIFKLFLASSSSSLCSLRLKLGRNFENRLVKLEVDCPIWTIIHQSKRFMAWARGHTKQANEKAGS